MLKNLCRIFKLLLHLYVFYKFVVIGFYDFVKTGTYSFLDYAIDSIGITVAFAIINFIVIKLKKNKFNIYKWQNGVEYSE